MNTIAIARFVPRMPGRQRSHTHGFTLVELMVTVAVAALLLAIAAPTFKSTLQRWRVNSAKQTYAASLYLARRAAIKHGDGVLMHRRAPDANCPYVTEARDWGCGWNICIDTDGNGKCTTPQEPPIPSDDVLLQSVSNLAAVNIVLSINTSRLKFSAWGHPNGLGALGVTFSPADENANTSIVSTLCMSSGGRIRFVPTASCR